MIRDQKEKDREEAYAEISYSFENPEECMVCSD
jgi:hypothetical protein